MDEYVKDVTSPFLDDYTSTLKDTVGCRPLQREERRLQGEPGREEGSKGSRGEEAAPRGARKWRQLQGEPEDGVRLQGEPEDGGDSKGSRRSEGGAGAPTKVEEKLQGEPGYRVRALRGAEGVARGR